jgi:hypothetical protein
MPRRSRHWIWAGRAAFILIVATFTGYLSKVGLEDADKTASVVSAVLAMLALCAPYLLPPPRNVNAASQLAQSAAGEATEVQPPLSEPAASPDIRVSDTGKAVAGSSESANTGLRAPAVGPAGRFVVERTGDAEATDGGTANTGVWLT